jgi:uncharacterized protein (TIRG00374 family)
MKLSSNFIRALIGTLLGGLIAYLLMREIKPGEFSNAFKNLSVFWVIVSFVFYLLSTVLRSYRWKIMLLSKSVKLSSLFYVTCLHNLLNQLLPARTGEISYVVLLKKTQSVPASEGAATLILARIIDVLAMGFFFILSIFFFWNSIKVPVVHLLLMTIFILPLIFLIFIGIFSRKGVQFITQYFGKIGLLKFKLFRKFSDFLVRLAEDLYQIKISGSLYKYGLFTLLAWGAKFFAFYAMCMNLSFSEPITFGETVLGTTFSELASTLPIYGFAGLGTIEAGWSFGFLLLGFPKSEVIISAFCFHFFLFTYSAILGLISFFLLKKHEK